jgi:hypothetical protein
MNNILNSNYGLAQILSTSLPDNRRLPAPSSEGPILPNVLRIFLNNGRDFYTENPFFVQKIRKNHGGYRGIHRPLEQFSRLGTRKQPAILTEFI